VAFDGNTIVSGSYDRTVHIWHAPFYPDRGCSSHGYGVRRVWLCPAPNQHIVISTDGSTINLTDIRKNARVCEFNTAYHVAVVGGRLVNSYHAYSFNYLEVRDVHNASKSTKCMDDDDAQNNGNSMAVYCMGALSPVPDHPDLLVTGGCDGKVHLWNLKTGTHIKLMRK
jgi:WD40 repeat protein